MAKSRVKRKKVMSEDVKRFEFVFFSLGKRITALSKDLGRPSKKTEATFEEAETTLLAEIFGAMDVLETVVRIKARKIKDPEDLMDAVDDYIDENGFYLKEDPYRNQLKVFLKDPRLFLIDLQKNIEDLADTTGLDALYLAEKIYQAFDHIEDYFSMVDKINA